MSGVLYFIVAVLVLAVMIFIHELGHFSAGRLLGFKILDFSIGFGPALFQFKKKNINYALRAIPLGGACRFYGEEDDPKELKGDDGAVPFNAQKPWKRLIVIFAGPFMNFLLAYLLAVVMMTCYGNQKAVAYENGDDAVVITDFAGNSRAELSGVMENDIIIAVNGSDISGEPHSFEEKTDIISEEIANAPAEGLTLKVMRDGEIKEIFISDIYNAEQEKNVLGITMGMMAEFVPEGFFSALGSGFDFLVRIVRMTFEALANGFRNGFNQGEVSGIVGTVAITMKMASMGLYHVLLVMVIISMSLGIMNLLPILPLDGGHLLFDFIELVFRKPVPRKIQNALSLVGFGLLMMLMVYATVSDIRGLFNGMFDF
ncbi:MAG: site-2 protease family protein [Clostridia bacterium]|nr:site-2 protease family protein [Clostridia bacterium]